MIRKSISSLLFLFFGAFLVIYSSCSLGDFQQFGAAFMPTISGIGIILFSLLDLSFNLKQDLKKSNNGEIKHVLIISFIIIFYVLASGYLGFIVTGLIITAPLMMLYARCSKIQSLIISSGIVISVYYLFSKVLLVPLPQLFS